MARKVCLTHKIFSTSARVYYEDTDAGGVVYHANYLKYMERCRSEWLENIGFNIVELQENQGVIFAVRSAEINYIAPARLFDTLTIDCDVLHVGKVKLQIVQNIYNDGQLLCSAAIKLATLDRTSFKLRPMPKELHVAISAGQKDN